MFDSWKWLIGTFWIVPEEYLAAPWFPPGGEQPRWLLDQTVWQITGYAGGYFWGNTAVRLAPPAKSGDESTPAAQRLMASITPEGNVHITFVPESSTGDAQATIGIGNMRWRDGAWMAEMQMSAPAGSGGRILHWACMQQCTPDDAAWQQLPGTSQSLPDFMSAAGFTV